ncbi:unnamed protein product, partial [Rotaria sp. Silwood2]
MAADAVFNQVDLNKDGRVDIGEFNNFLGQNGSAGSWETSSVGGGWGTGAGWSAGWGGGAGWDASASGYELGASGVALGGAYDASYAVGGGFADAGLVGAGASYQTLSSGAAYGGDAAFIAGGAGYGSSAVSQVHYATDAQGLFQDPNPQIIRRPAPGGVQTYTQNVRVRFLQPPPVPPPG